MSQKSTFPQPGKFVSKALTLDTCPQAFDDRLRQPR
jgi:hypothetical protein